MKRIFWIALCAVVFLIFAAGGTVVYALQKPSTKAAGGQSRPSPDRQWVAHATTVEESAPIGKRRRFSELRIDSAGPSPKTVRRMVIEDTAEPAMDWRIEGEVFWAKNSASVTFKCVTGKANLEMTLTP
ncbi:MAG TPA: hypothetical protein VF773_13425 [Verrucomicrobiae bacterium]